MSCNKGFLCKQGREKRGMRAGEEHKPTLSVIPRGNIDFSSKCQQLLLLLVEFSDTTI